MTWWRRNRLWLIILVPLVALAVAASSFRLVTLYLPWQWSSPIVANDSSGTLSQRYMELDGVTRDREVRVEALSVLEYPEFGGVAAVDGATLWRVWLEFEAAPDQFLQGCEVEILDSSGTRYDYRNALRAANEDDYFSPPVLEPCVPEDAPGPTIDVFEATVIESESERPGTWRDEFLVAVPDGVEPAQVRVAWSQPVFLVLEIP